MVIVDLDKYNNRSYPLPLVLNSGDVIFIPEKKQTLLSIIGGVIYSLIYVAAGFLISRV